MSNWYSPLKGIVAVAAKADHPVWNEIFPELLPTEFKNPYEMDVEFLRLLSKIRREAQVPMRIISDARDPQGSVGASKSAHKKRPCRAVDIRVDNAEERAKIVITAIRHGLVRLGVYQGKSQTSIHPAWRDQGTIHLDAETHQDNPSPRMWTRY